MICPGRGHQPGTSLGSRTGRAEVTESVSVRYPYRQSPLLQRTQGRCSSDGGCSLPKQRSIGCAQISVVFWQVLDLCGSKHMTDEAFEALRSCNPGRLPALRRLNLGVYCVCRAAIDVQVKSHVLCLSCMCPSCTPGRRPADVSA